MTNAFSAMNTLQVVVDTAAVAITIWICKKTAKAVTDPATRAATKSFLRRVIATKTALALQAAVFGGLAVRGLILALAGSSGQISRDAMIVILAHTFSIVFWMIVILVWLPFISMLQYYLRLRQERLLSVRASGLLPDARV